MDDQQNMLPVGWYITEQETSSSLRIFLEALLQKCRNIDPDFKFAVALSDDSSAQQLAIRYSKTLPCLF